MEAFFATVPSFQTATFYTFLLALAGCLGYWIKGMPERARVKNEETTLTAKIEEDLRSEAAIRFQEFRNEVHELRNELTVLQADLNRTSVTSERRGTKVNMVLFILNLVMDELHRKDPTNPILDQARVLLKQVEPEREPEHGKKD
jgi:hypothetical protein